MENNLLNQFNDSGYLVLNLNEYLNDTELTELEYELDTFVLDLDNIKSSIGFLGIDFDYSTLEEKDIDFINRIFEQKYITYLDYLTLCDLNKKYNIEKNRYFNFMLASIQQLPNIRKYFNIAYVRILKDLFGVELNPNKNLLMGHMNVYPKESFIRKHKDGDNTQSEILCTSLFFLSKNRKYEDGSLLRVFENSGEIIDIVPDYKTVVILNHVNNNLLHEVTENLIDDVRLSLYTPLEKKYLTNK